MAGAVPGPDLVPEADGVTYVSGPGVVPGRLATAEIVESKDYDLVALADG